MTLTACAEPEGYAAFLHSKALVVQPSGIDVENDAIHPSLFPFQRDMTRWSLRKGRAALFETTGLGKTRQQIEWARLTGERALILAPLAVARQTVREGAAIGVPIVYARAQTEAAPAGLTITNYEMLHAFDPGAFGAVVLDECFAKGTLIDTPSGKMHIEELIIGDEILNASGTDRVSDVHRRAVPYAIRITANGQKSTSSPNHPYFTQRGWIGAQDLCPGDEILATSESVRLVRDGVLAEVSGQPRSEVLRDILLSEMAYEPAGTSGQSAYARSCPEARRETASLVCVGQPEGRSRERENPLPQPNRRPRGSGEDFPPIERDGPQTFRAWGQRTWFDEASTDLAGCARTDLGSGVSFVVGQTDSRLSSELQTRLGQSRAANQYRSGWSVPPQPEGGRCEAGRESAFARVDRLEVLEPGHPDLEHLRDADGKLYFYDLGATRHPSFSVNGLLVHNSSILKNFEGKVRSNLIAAFRDTPYRLCATATPAPNDIAELANHAEFLGVMKREEMLAAFFVHDDTGWRLKGHAREPFYRWLASWGMSLQRPSDLGYSDDGYALPPLEITACLVPTTFTRPGQLFATDLKGIGDRAAVRRETASERVAETVRIIRESWNLQSGLNQRGIPPNTIGSGTLETGSTCSLSNENTTPTCHQKSESDGSNTAETTTRGTVRSNSTNRLSNEQRSLTKNENGASNSGTTTTPETESGSRPSPSLIASPIQVENWQATSSEPMGSKSASTSASSKSIAADVPSAESRQGVGGTAATSTTTTQRAPSEESSARPATWASGSSETVENGYSLPLNTSPATLEPWIVWCGLNTEQDAVAEALGDLAISIYGTLSPEEKESRMDAWLNGERPVLVTKVGIAGFGLNLQRCARMVFVGLSDSYEQYFQAIRRCWRFGQQRGVHAYIVLTEPEEAIYANVCRKQREAEATAAELVKHVAVFEQAEIASVRRREDTPHTQPLRLPSWVQGAA